MKQRLTIMVERGKGKNNYACFSLEKIGTYCPAGYGSTAREAVEDLETSIEEMRSLAAERGQSFPEEVEMELRFDLGAFFNYYPLDTTAVARYIGMNPSVLRQYATALRQPRPAQLEKIRHGINQLAHDLGSWRFAEKRASLAAE